MARQVSRLQIDVRPALIARFNRLLVLGELSTQRELLDTSVTVLEWAVNQRLNGRIVGSLDESTGIFRELNMPYLEACSLNSLPPRPVPQFHAPRNAVASDCTRAAVTRSEPHKGGGGPTSGV
jgi:hypothetical protein